jgi:hypothetical protein
MMDHAHNDERLQVLWEQAEQAAVAVFQDIARAGTDVHATGASYGFTPKHKENQNVSNLPKPGFHPLVEHAGQASAHASLGHAQALDGWLGRLATGCIPFLRAYKDALPMLQGPLSFCAVRVELDCQDKATLHVNGIRVDIPVLDFKAKALHLQPAAFAFGGKNTPVSAHSIQEAIALWEIARI